jgi:hypothetical protein
VIINDQARQPGLAKCPTLLPNGDGVATDLVAKQHRFKNQRLRNVDQRTGAVRNVD